MILFVFDPERAQKTMTICCHFNRTFAKGGCWDLLKTAPSLHPRYTDLGTELYQYKTKARYKFNRAIPTLSATNLVDVNFHFTVSSIICTAVNILKVTS